MRDDEKQKTSPPYVAWRTFLNFISSLRETGLPSQINRSVMSHLSYSTQAQLLAALRSLGMTDAAGTPTSILAQLVDANEKNQGAVINKILRDNYAFIFNNLDLSRATPDELDNQFKKVGISGSTVGRAVAFFLGAAGSSGYALSAHIKKIGTPSTGAKASRPTRKRRIQAKPNVETKRGVTAGAPNANGFEHSLLNKFPDFDPNWPEEIKKSWFEGFKQLMDMAPQKPES
jgi:Family of unknown function (DUF5343)